MALETRSMSKVKLQRIDSANQGGHVGALMILSSAERLACKRNRLSASLTLWLTLGILLKILCESFWSIMAQPPSHSYCDIDMLDHNRSGMTLGSHHDPNY